MSRLERHMRRRANAAKTILDQQRTVDSKRALIAELDHRAALVRAFQKKQP